MIADAVAAIRQIFSPDYRGVLWKVLGLTLVLLCVADVFLFKLLSAHLAPLNAWVAAVLSLVSGLGMAIGSLFLLPAVSLLVAGFFLDSLAETTEAEIYPPAPLGVALPLGQAMMLSLRFALVSLGVNLIALLLLLVPGINAGIFLIANAFLFAREYFALAAMRFMPQAEAVRLRQDHAFQVYGAGLLIAFFVSVPILNLLTPLFGTSFMVRLVKRLRSPQKRLTQESAISLR